MKKILIIASLSFLFVSTISFVGYSENNKKSENTMPESKFPKKVDGVFNKAEYIDLDDGARLYIKYGPISDSGIEVEKVFSNKIIWRIYAQPLNVMHTEYEHQVWVRIEGNIFHIKSIGSYGTFDEKRNLGTGELLERKEKNNQNL